MSFSKGYSILDSFKYSHVLHLALLNGLIEFLYSSPQKLSNIEAITVVPKNVLKDMLVLLIEIGVIESDSHGYIASQEFRRQFSPDQVNRLVTIAKWSVFQYSSYSQHLGAHIGNDSSAVIDGEFIDMWMESVHLRTEVVVPSKRMMKSLIGFIPNSILEVGPGSGEFTKLFLSIYLDSVVTLVEQAKVMPYTRKCFLGCREVSRVNFCEGNIFEWNDEKTYDLIYATNILHLFDEFSIKILAEKLWSLLNIDGTVLLGGYFVERDSFNLDGSLLNYTMWVQRGEDVPHLDQLVDIFETCGFSCLHSKGLHDECNFSYLNLKKVR